MPITMLIRTFFIAVLDSCPVFLRVLTFDAGPDHQRNPNSSHLGDPDPGDPRGGTRPEEVSHGLMEHSQLP